MKKTILSVFMMLLYTLSFSQTINYQSKISKEKVPKIIMESLQRDFPTYSVKEYFGVPIEVVDDVWYADTGIKANLEDFETFSVHLQSVKGNIRATYNKQGKLLNTRERLVTLPLPLTIQNATENNFPGWKIHGDKIVLTTYKPNFKKVHYKVNLQKDNKVINVIFDADGNLKKGMQHSVHHKTMASS